MEERQIPIWFFIGGLLAIYGVLILGTGIYLWLKPPTNPTALHEYHPDVWWGLLLLGLGLFYSVRYRPSVART